jgi:hypothetical protein
MLFKKTNKKFSFEFVFWKNERERSGSKMLKRLTRYQKKKKQTRMYLLPFA